jgi:hypothetical protein
MNNYKGETELEAQLRTAREMDIQEAREEQLREAKSAIQMIKYQLQRNLKTLSQVEHNMKNLSCEPDMYSVKSDLFDYIEEVQQLMVRIDSYIEDNENFVSYNSGEL